MHTEQALRHRTAVSPLVCPTRIISYAWGDQYAEDLLALTIPALLAPGNLPAVASKVKCDVVLLTERRLFPRFQEHPSFHKLEAICPVRLMSLDDLMVTSDKYGMTLTYTLHRGFGELGPAVTDWWLMFLNADFVLADGSLANLLKRLSRGDRIVAAPSYCANAESASSELRSWVDAKSGILSIPHRDLAGITLRHRHNSIRGKTVNRPMFHHHYADQFYWAIGRDVLLGHQMPVSIVGLRPEREVKNPNSYWDYGLIREFCPTAEYSVMGDSDDFLMLELRKKDAVDQYLSDGPPDLKVIGGRMVGWVTPYQRDFAQFPLTLHSGDLPPDLEIERGRLQQFTREVLSHAPAELPSHVDHPQWTYHQPDFDRGRALNEQRALAGAETKSETVAAEPQVADAVQPDLSGQEPQQYAPFLNRLFTWFGAALVKNSTLEAYKTESEILRTQIAHVEGVEAALRLQRTQLEAEFSAFRLQSKEQTYQLLEREFEIRETLLRDAELQIRKLEAAGRTKGQRSEEPGTKTAPRN